MSRYRHADQPTLLELLIGASIAITFPLWIPYWLKLWEWGATLLLGA